MTGLSVSETVASGNYFIEHMPLYCCQVI